MLRMAIGSALLSFLISGCCTKAAFEVLQPPRFTNCTGAQPGGGNNDPTPRPGEDAGRFNGDVARAHADCDPAHGQTLISGFDLLHQFKALENIAPDERVFEWKEVSREEWYPGVAGCTGPVTVNDAPLLYFLVPGTENDDQFHCCEMRIKVHEEGGVALIPLSKIPKGVNAALSAPGVPVAQSLSAADLRPFLTPQQQQDLRKAIDECFRKVHWTVEYEYDRCNTSPQTSCKLRRCFDLSWSDQSGGGHIVLNQ